MLQLSISYLLSGLEYLSQEDDEGVADSLVAVHGGDPLEHGAAGRARALLCINH